MAKGDEGKGCAHWFCKRDKREDDLHLGKSTTVNDLEDQTRTVSPVVHIDIFISSVAHNRIKQGRSTLRRIEEIDR